jgi:hypothetical protein
MNFSAVQTQLSDLPTTFKRQATPFTQWLDALAAALTTFTAALDGLVLQTNFPSAQYGWVDVWGTIFGVQRRSNEPDSTYIARIQNTVIAAHVTPVAMLLWLSVIEGITAQLADSPVAVGYTLTLPSTLSTAQINAILLNLAYVRPAGMPFAVHVEAGGTYLNTVDYIGAPRATGIYLGGAFSIFPMSIPSATGNSLSIVPDLLFTDPTLNPGLS